MKPDKSYPEEMFEQRLQRYRDRKRTKGPAEVHAETGKRVNRLLDGSAHRFVFSEHFSIDSLCRESAAAAKLPLDLFAPEMIPDILTGEVFIRGRAGTVILGQPESLLAAAAVFIQYLQSRSCGQCTFCRIGTQRIRETMDDFLKGGCTVDKIETLVELAEQIKSASLCEVGRLAEKPLKSLLKLLTREIDRIDER